MVTQPNSPCLEPLGDTEIQFQLAPRPLILIFNITPGDPEYHYQLALNPLALILITIIN
jgi:hypothetical protein